MKRILLLLPLLLIAIFMCIGHDVSAIFHHPGAILMGVPIIGANDARIAYSNTYRSLLKKATKNFTMKGKYGAADGPKWLPNVGNKLLAQSDLISEVQINGSKTSYQFGINVNQIENQQTTIYSTERRLTLQNQFYVSQVGYFLRIVEDPTGYTGAENTLFTHFPGQWYGAAGITDPLMMTPDVLWSGNLELSVNQRTVVPEWDLWRHREVPQTQYPVYNGFAGGWPDYTFVPVNDENYGSQSGMYPCEPMWILDGAYDNVLTVNFNNDLSVLDLNDWDIHMVVVMRGILAQNCSKLMEPGIMNPL